MINMFNLNLNQIISIVFFNLSFFQDVNMNMMPGSWSDSNPMSSASMTSSPNSNSSSNSWSDKTSNGQNGSNDNDSKDPSGDF